MDALNILFYLFIANVNGVTVNAEDGVATRTSGERSRPVVRIKTQGLVRGRRARDGDYDQFTGIPYATASKENRFKSPLPVPTWAGIREADSPNVACAQYNDETNKVVGTEDCLVLNVYTPRCAKPSNRLPVMVFIHGGGFNMGSAERHVYGPKRFVEENVVLVTFNYRLSILGFMCSGNIANGGLKDAVAVLEWIKENIEAFGGDPNKVTLFGQSAGSAMVEMLMLSNRTKRLITGAISQSGVTTSPWAFGSDPDEKVRRVATLLGYEGNDPEERLRILKNASADDLISTTERLVLMTPYEFLPVSPCIEPANNPGAVVTADPNEAIRSGDYNDIPYALGFTKDEAMLLYPTVEAFPNFFEKLNEDFKYSLPKELQSLHQADAIADTVKSFYFGNQRITEQSMPIAVKYFTDVTYALSSVQMARRYIRSRRRSPVYMYEFAYDGGQPYLKKILNITNVPGVCHADELAYMFTPDGYNLVRADDKLTARRLVKLWTNFAKFNDPTPRTSALMPVKWTRVTENLDYLLIDRDVQMSRKPFPDRIDFWDELYRNYTG